MALHQTIQQAQAGPGQPFHQAGGSATGENFRARLPQTIRGYPG